MSIITHLPVSRTFTTAIVEALRRLDRLRIKRTAPLLLQNAPLAANTDREALPPGSASRAAVKLWALAGDAALERLIRVNAYSEDPETMRDGASDAARRLEVVLALAGDRMDLSALAPELSSQTG